MVVGEVAAVLDDYMSELASLGVLGSSILGSLASVALPAVATAGALVFGTQGAVNMVERAQDIVSEGIGYTGAKLAEGSSTVTYPWSGTTPVALPSFSIPASFAPAGASDLDFAAAQPLQLTRDYAVEESASFATPVTLPQTRSLADTRVMTEPEILVPDQITYPNRGGGNLHPSNGETPQINIPPVLTAGIGGGILGSITGGAMGNALGSIGGSSVPAINISINVQSNNREDILDL